MGFTRQVDERAAPLTIANEVVSIPSVTAYVVELTEVPDSSASVSLRRVGPTTKSGTGSGSFTSGGLYTGFTANAYRLQIDTAGDVGPATFKWGTVVGGVVTWRGTLIPIDSVDPIDLELGITMTPGIGAGQDFDLDDYWDFTAEYWSEVGYIPTESKQFQTDYSTGKILFHSADAGKTVYATYEGRGSLAKAEVINELQAAVEAIQAGGLLLTMAVVCNGDVITSNGEIVFIIP